MLKKIFFIILLLNLLNHCEYKPVYSNQNKVNYKIIVTSFNGDKEISFPSGYDNDAKVVIRQSQPLPMTVLAIMRRSNTFDA